MLKKIYSYIIKSNSGFAPCFENNLFSLACCKRDLRRVVGRQYAANLASRDNPIWVCAIYGKTNENKCIPGSICYIAKITGIETYYHYFTKSEYSNRKDCIYEIYKEKWNSEAVTAEMWKLRGTSKYHDRKNEQEIDWDLYHKSKECYVLLSNEFRFLEEIESEQCLSMIENQTCKGVGHKIIELENNSKIFELLENLILKGTNENILINDSLNKKNIKC